VYGKLFDPEDIPTGLRQYFEEVQVPCGAPWTRVVKRTVGPECETLGPKNDVLYAKSAKYTPRLNGAGWRKQPRASSTTLGFRPSCACGVAETTPAIVLDPFIGSGTTAVVAKKLGRRYIGIDLNPSYCQMAEKRLERILL